jgi:polysaccharide pyruvyl transferase WcaK-like protein
MKKLRVLHVASFLGNIGDNANHTGFRKSLLENLDFDLEFTEFEIRTVFRKQAKFDNTFVDLANSFDLLVVGGGNYFELWVDSSQTGTSIDIELPLFKQIKTPIIFNALGVDPAQGATEESVNKFRKFLDVVISSEHMLLSCRNDGSLKALYDIVGAQYAKHFFHVPDAGFFTTVKNYNFPELEKDKKNIVIQLAGDMLDTRFPGGSELNSYEDFLTAFCACLTNLTKQGANLIFVPHIFRDLNVIHDVLDSLPDEVRRENVSVAPYLVGQKGQDYIFGLYKETDLVLGMRFHANVCAIGLNTPCIGLVNYRQIDELYNELEINQFKVDVRKKAFELSLESLSTKLLQGKSTNNDEVLESWKLKLKRFHSHINDWLKLRY